MSRLLQLKVVLSAVDRVVRPLRAVGMESKSTAREVKAIRDRLRDLNAAQGQLDALRKLQGDAQATSAALKNAQTVARVLRQQFEATEKPTRAMGVQMRAAQREADRLQATHGQQTARLLELRRAMNAAGVRNLADHQRQLTSETAQATAALQRQEAALAAVNKRAQQMHAARANYDRTMQTRNAMAGAGVSMGIAGASIGAPLLKVIRDYSSFEDAMAGVARQVEGTRDAQGRLTPAYWEMAAAIQDLAGRKIPLATTEIAALVEAGARMGIQGKANLLAFAETAGVSAAAFDTAASEIGDSLGKIANLYKIPIARISELGDAINWLDDNAQSSGADIIEVLQRVGGLADKLDYRKAAALGSTFLSLGSSPEVAASAVNALVRELSIAQAQPKKFQAGLEALRLSARDVQDGMVKDATGTILRVMESINKLPANQQLTVTTQLFGKEFGDDAAKLASNLKMYRDQLALVHGEESRGSMQREAEIKNQLLSARWQMTQNRLFAQTAALGRTLQPTLLAVMEGVGGILNATTRWVEAHPTLTGWILKGAAALSILLIAMGGLTLGMAALLGPFAMVRFGMAMFGVQSFGLLGVLRGVATGGLAFLGGALKATWALLLTNPIGWVIIAVTALAAGAYLLYRNWDTVRGMLDGVWAGFTGRIQALQSAWGAFRNALASGDWTGIGKAILQGIVAGLDLATGGLLSKAVGIAGSLTAAVKEKLGIRSPSRVFAQLGAFTMAGLQRGILGAEGGPLSAMAGVSDRLVGAGASGGTMPMRPLSAGSAQPISGSARGGDTFHIHAAPGMDERMVADMVVRKIEERDRQRAARNRSRLTDDD
ncbi:MAG: phage tail tape measure protein [Moraxellaceae bacterium]|nr:phage tail tape measure protein [Moraxellaceae bacterium]